MSPPVYRGDLIRIIDNAYNSSSQADAQNSPTEPTDTHDIF